MPDISWLTAKPIAHRGFHDAHAGRIENTPSAVKAAMERGLPVEVDVQELADGDALVFHDDKLDRLTFETGPVIEKRFEEISEIPMRGTDDKLWRLDDLLRLVDGQVGICIEIKSLLRKDSQRNFVTRIATRLKHYTGPVVVKTFDPDMLGVLREIAPDLPRGIVAEGARDPKHYGHLTRIERFVIRHILHAPRTRPHFISYNVHDLPAFGPSILKRWFGLPIITWTVRTQEDRQRAKLFADQMVFEGFDPDGDTGNRTSG
ncbi:glycerophosphodiester phosphodiesterase [Rhizobiales bacterium]|uniref:glycerophosphodiester phosphodiesterase family protein n=1 Tax=Hongsoonwoonella zoysiae TaxID=2821844 RepID=UPI0015607FD3|nr:glycerophosphodiester phosphodiesterase family protein [Hongsoonwoonella zoysiae]NRG19180.1 glycerophosphodiester phosphodiesterase [Hongsoonwoonella zoysiae]